MKRRLFLVLTLLLLCQPAWAANRYFLKVGGNFSDTTKWAASSASANSNTNDGATPTTGDAVFLDNTGNCVIDANTANLGSFDMTGYTGTLSGTTNISISGVVSSTQNVIFSGTVTWTGLLYFNITGGSGKIINFTTNSKLIHAIQIHGANVSKVVLQDNLSFDASKTASLTIESGGSTIQPLDPNGKTITGNSSTNRLLIKSVTLGTPQIISSTVLATTFNNVDFRDITFTTAGALDLTNGQVNSIGDCGGNTASGGALTFTTSATQNATIAGAQSWSTAGIWTSRVPLPQDDTTFTGWSAGTLTVDMPRIGRTIDTSGATAGRTLTLGNAVTNYGGLDLSGVTTTNSGGNSWVIESQARTGTVNLKSGGLAFTPAIFLNNVGATVSLVDALNNSGVRLTQNNGTFIDNGFSVSADSFSSTGTATRSVVKTGNWTFTKSGTGNIVDLTTTTGLTWSDTAGTINISNTGANQKTFVGGSKIFYNLQLPSGTGGVLISGSNSFNKITAPSGGKLTLTNGTTQTITQRYGLANGTNVVTVLPDAGTATIAHQGTTSWDYVNLTNILYSGGTGYAGPLAHSTDGGGNTNWVFTQAPRGRMARFKGRTIGYPGVSRSGAFNAS